MGSIWQDRPPPLLHHSLSDFPSRGEAQYCPPLAAFTSSTAPSALHHPPPRGPHQFFTAPQSRPAGTAPGGPGSWFANRSRPVASALSFSPQLNAPYQQPGPSPPYRHPSARATGSSTHRRPTYRPRPSDAGVPINGELSLADSTRPLFPRAESHSPYRSRSSPCNTNAGARCLPSLYDTNTPAFLSNRGRRFAAMEHRRPPPPPNWQRSRPHRPVASHSGDDDYILDVMGNAHMAVLPKRDDYRCTPPLSSNFGGPTRLQRPRFPFPNLSQRNNRFGNNSSSYSHCTGAEMFTLSSRRGCNFSATTPTTLPPPPFDPVSDFGTPLEEACPLVLGSEMCAVSWSPLPKQYASTFISGASPLQSSNQSLVDSSGQMSVQTSLAGSFEKLPEMPRSLEEAGHGGGHFYEEKFTAEGHRSFPEIVGPQLISQGSNEKPVEGVTSEGSRGLLSIPPADASSSGVIGPSDSDGVEDAVKVGVSDPLLASCSSISPPSVSLSAAVTLIDQLADAPLLQCPIGSTPLSSAMTSSSQLQTDDEEARSTMSSVIGWMDAVAMATRRANRKNERYFVFGDQIEGEDSDSLASGDIIVKAPSLVDPVKLTSVDVPDESKMKGKRKGNSDEEVALSLSGDSDTSVVIEGLKRKKVKAVKVGEEVLIDADVPPKSTGYEKEFKDEANVEPADAHQQALAPPPRQSQWSIRRIDIGSWRARGKMCGYCCIATHRTRLCPRPPCGFCSSQNHFSGRCPHRWKVCDQCGGRGHLGTPKWWHCPMKRVERSIRKITQRKRRKVKNTLTCIRCGNVGDHTICDVSSLNIKRPKHETCYVCGGRDHLGSDCEWRPGAAALRRIEETKKFQEKQERRKRKKAEKAEGLYNTEEVTIVGEGEQDVTLERKKSKKQKKKSKLCSVAEVDDEPQAIESPSAQSTVIIGGSEKNPATLDSDSSTSNKKKKQNKKSRALTEEEASGYPALNDLKALEKADSLSQPPEVTPTTPMKDSSIASGTSVSLAESQPPTSPPHKKHKRDKSAAAKKSRNSSVVCLHSSGGSSTDVEVVSPAPIASRPITRKSKRSETAEVERCSSNADVPSHDFPEPLDSPTWERRSSKASFQKTLRRVKKVANQNRQVYQIVTGTSVSTKSKTVKGKNQKYRKNKSHLSQSAMLDNGMSAPLRKKKRDSKQKGGQAADSPSQSRRRKASKGANHRNVFWPSEPGERKTCRRASAALEEARSHSDCHDGSKEKRQRDKSAKGKKKNRSRSYQRPGED